MTATLVHNLKVIQQRIDDAAKRYDRPLSSVSLLAISKTFAAEQIATLARAGQRDFGESYVKEARIKMTELADFPLTWHFVGKIQTNKAREVAEHFSWAHTVSRLKDAEQLSRFRPPHLAPLKLCIQVKLDDNPNKNGIPSAEVPALVTAIQSLPYLSLQGLMTLPPQTQDFSQQRAYFHQLQQLQKQLIDNGNRLDTLSMGMTHDFEAAIAEGATWVRIGSGLFGQRIQAMENL